MRYFALSAAAIAAGLSMLGPTASTPAEAAHCRYKGVTVEGRALDWVQGNGYAFKQDNACDRARRECHRDLERHYRRGDLPRGVVCKRTA
ncbi:MAG TPA: hypothetical protein PK264_10725 [Hyphomicrobiaceae bacterium]|nr:hypothetical protein [Hyphomicrobiaceae bacterium]